MISFLFEQNVQTFFKQDKQAELLLLFQKSVKNIFIQTAKMQFIPASLARQFGLNVWKNYVSASSLALQTGNFRILSTSNLLL